MTLTIEVPQKLEEAIKAAAELQGVPLESVVADVFAMGADGWLQDAEDAAEARRILAETDPEDYVPWEQVKAYNHTQR